VNPAAGGGRARRYWERCEAALPAAIEARYTTRRGEARELAAGAGERLVVAVGGDGTMHEVVNGLLSQRGVARPRLGVLQCGTGSDWQRTVPGPRRPAQVRAWLEGECWRTIDAGVLQASAGRRYFLNAADVGIGATVVRRAEGGLRLAGGTANFLLAAVVSLLTHRNSAVRMSIDGGPVESIRVRTIAIANGRFFGGGMQVAPDAQPDDGLLDVVVIGDVSLWLGVRSLPLLYRGRHGRLPQVRFARARSISIESDDAIGVEADGELVGGTPVRFEVVPSALDLLCWKE
jgi:diacylglycerol kinase (ATP)